MNPINLDDLFPPVHPHAVVKLEMGGEVFNIPVRTAGEYLDSSDDPKLRRPRDKAGKPTETDSEYWRRVVDVIFRVPEPAAGRPSKEATEAKDQAERFWKLITGVREDGTVLQWNQAHDVIAFALQASQGVIDMNKKQPDPKGSDSPAS